jgi:O-Antigen ligase
MSARAATDTRTVAARARLVSPTGLGVVPFGLAAVAVALLACAKGGYYPTSWGLATVAAAEVACTALLAHRRFDLPRGGWLALGSLGAFCVWTAATAFGPGNATVAAPVVERELLYLAVFWAALIVARFASLEMFAAGILGGITAVMCYGLELFLVPGRDAVDPLEGRLLYQPVGYANAMGALAAIGIALALGLAAHAARGPIRVLAAGSLVPLTATLWFSASRAAVAALAISIALTLLLDPQRRRWLATTALISPPALLAVWIASRSQAGNPNAEPALIAHDGRIVALTLALSTPSALAIGYALLQRNRRPSAHPWMLWVAALAGAILISAAATKGVSGGLGDRLSYWSAAWDDIRAHPLLGSGAGSFQQVWLQHRTQPVAVLNAHSLYIETLAELGPLGLATLAGALALPLVAAVRARRNPIVTALFGAYIVFVVHAGLDWDWQLPAVTVSGLLCAASLLVIAQPQKARRRRRRTPAALITVTLAVAALAAFAAVGNRQLAASEHAANRGDWITAGRDAMEASRWQPWSSEPRFLIADAKLATGDRAGALADFDAAIRTSPDDWRIWYEIGRSGDRQQRKRALAALLYLNPLLVEHHKGRGVPPS